MSYEKQTWEPYNDELTEEQNIQVGAVVTAERMNHLETGLEEHDKNKSNPHQVTKEQIELGNVSNVEQASKIDFNSHKNDKTNPHNVTKSQVGLGNVSNVEQASKTDFLNHASNKTNPHDVTKDQVNLGNVDNYATATQEEAEAGESSVKYMTPLRVFQAISKWVQGKFVNKTSDEDVSGVKNFTDIPTVNGLPVAIDQGVAYKEVTIASDNEYFSGTVSFWRNGNIVVVGSYFTLKKASWNTMVTVPVGYRPQKPTLVGAKAVTPQVRTAAGNIYMSGNDIQFLSDTGYNTGSFKFNLIYITTDEFPN